MEPAIRGSSRAHLRGSDPADRLIVALDYPSAGAALALIDQLDGTCRWFKVGMELYYAAGNEIVERLLERDLKVFLDLKLHDIPNTVAGAIRSVSRLGASLLTLHASGGEPMMRAAAEAAELPNAPELLAVTVLTSMDAAQLAAVGVASGESAPGAPPSVQPQVLRLARLARVCGIQGLVCSAEEVAAAREIMGPGATLVVPGIRPASANPAASPDDQRRIATPAQAIARGASMLVVGRPVTQAPDPAAAAAKILGEIASAT
ncbi:MAG TPA: orotidine-5'-phosphate decarboxylase [Acidobacteriaceae bacterium]|nr:orotidine-5'-phosphate decarboxylase [Acidobacteriaceae bacterium]